MRFIRTILPPTIAHIHRFSLSRVFFSKNQSQAHYHRQRYAAVGGASEAPSQFWATLTVWNTAEIKA